MQRVFIALSVIVVLFYQTNAYAEWRVDIESKTVDQGQRDVTVDFTFYWDLAMNEIDIPIVVRQVDPGSFWRGDLPYHYYEDPDIISQGVTWNWSNPGWANVYEQVFPGIPELPCDDDGDEGYDGDSPDHFAVSALGIGYSTPAEPGGRVCLTIEFDANSTPGQFEFDTACFAASIHTIRMIDFSTSTDHGPAGTDEVTFNKGVITIEEGTWGIEIESKSVCPAAQDVTVDFTFSWELGLSIIELPIIVREIDPGAFWTGDLPYHYYENPTTFSQGVTWNWSNPGWPNVVEQVLPGIPAAPCNDDGDMDYDGLSPDHFLIEVFGLGSYTPAEPDGRVCLTLDFDVTGAEGQFEFDTACFAQPNSYSIFMVDYYFQDHGPHGTGEATFTKGVITIADDVDNDGVLCDVDNCPETWNPYQEDMNNNGIGDVCDDQDGDGVYDADDNCPVDWNQTQANSDNDEHGDACDNCPQIDNPDQWDVDNDSHGDECDNCPLVYNYDQLDTDGDDVGEICDNCPDEPNPTQADDDHDLVGDACDNCPSIANPGQEDFDDDGLGDLCDDDDDADGVVDEIDNCPMVSNGGQEDSDGDNIGDVCDNCPFLSNPYQLDNNGDGIGDACALFLSPVDYELNVCALALHAADIDGDGDWDLVANKRDPVPSEVMILINDGEGTFEPGSSYPTSGDENLAAASADFDGQNGIDLAVTNFFSDDFSVMLNDGTGAFSAPALYPAGDGPQSITTADYDAANGPDLAIANLYSNNISVLFNNGSGGFGTAINYSLSGRPGQIISVDLDGVNGDDLAVAVNTSDNIAILLNDGTGNFSGPTEYSAYYDPSSLGIIDFDDDGDNDLVVTGYRSDGYAWHMAHVLRNDGTGVFETAGIYPAGEEYDVVGGVATGDYNNDGKDDIAIVNMSQSGVAVLLNNGDETFKPYNLYPAGDLAAGDWPMGLCRADFDNDGDNDLALIEQTEGACIPGNSRLVILENVSEKQPVELWASITGRSEIKVGQPTTYMLYCGNSGATSLDNAVVRIELSPGLKCLAVESDETLIWSPATHPDQPIAFVLPKFGSGLVHPLKLTVQTSAETNPCDDGVTVPGFGIEYFVMGASQTFLKVGAYELVKYESDIYNGPDEAYWRYISLRVKWSFSETLIAYRTASAPSTFGDLLDLMVDNAVSDLTAVGWLSEATELDNKWSALASVNQFQCLLYDNFLDLYPPGSDWSNQAHSAFLPLEEVQAWDPNDKSGPVGDGSMDHFVTFDGELGYMVFFENVESATADAEDIIVVDTLDADLDWSTLNFGEMSHPEAGSASFDPVEGVITWAFDDIMLPPNVNPPEGEGWVSYSIRPQEMLSSGTIIQNRASIKFDYNPWIYAPMDSSYVINTIDAEPPSSSVDVLADSTSGSNLNVGWSGSDETGGSGIASYSIFYKVDGGPFQPWLVDTAATAAIFTGEPGHWYYFYSIAKDLVGHVEELPESFDAKTKLYALACDCGVWGDVNQDYQVNPVDVVYMVNFVYKNQDSRVPPPNCSQETGDVNCDQSVNPVDVVYYVNFVYKNLTPFPCDGCE